MNCKTYFESTELKVTAVWELRLKWLEREPWYAEDDGGWVGRGEKGDWIEATDSPKRHDLASLGVINHLRADTESGNTKVWSGTVSLEASFTAEARVCFATSIHCWCEDSTSPSWLKGFDLKERPEELNVTWPSHFLSLKTEFVWCLHSPVSLLNLWKKWD